MRGQKRYDRAVNIVPTYGCANSRILGRLVWSVNNATMVLGPESGTAGTESALVVGTSTNCDRRGQASGWWGRRTGGVRESKE